MAEIVVSALVAVVLGSILVHDMLPPKPRRTYSKAKPWLYLDEAGRLNIDGEIFFKRPEIQEQIRKMRSVFNG